MPYRELQYHKRVEVADQRAQSNRHKINTGKSEKSAEFSGEITSKTEDSQRETLKENTRCVINFEYRINNTFVYTYILCNTEGIFTLEIICVYLKSTFK